MSAEQLLREGKLDEARKALAEGVRSSPSDAKLRVFLFQIMCIMGDWDKAMTQLNVAADLDPQNLLMAQVCRTALNCEALRLQVFSGDRSPLIFGEPAQWVGLMLQALQHTAKGEHDAAATLRNQALEEAPAISGTLNDQPFEWMTDADSRLGPILEVIIEGRYYWAPMHNIASVSIEEPTDLRDMVWFPANIQWTNGGTVIGLIPTRYPGSESSSDDLVRLARKTEWEEMPGGAYIGMGQRVFATDQDDIALLDIRSITFDHPESAAPELVDESGGASDG